MRMEKSTKWLIAEISATTVVTALLGIFRYPPFLPHEWHKLLHVLGAVLFLGNILVTGGWMMCAERTGNAGVIRFAAGTLNWADIIFTVPGIFLLLANGLVISDAWGGVFRVGWLALSLMLFGISGIIWIVFLLRYQDRMIRISQSISEGNLPEEFFVTVHRWYLSGAIGALLPFISLALMVLKPGLR